MYKDIVKILKCPKCGEELVLTIENEEDGEVIEGKLKCKCNHQWAVRDGIVDFCSVEQQSGNNWSEVYKECDYDELDKEIAEGTPDNLKYLYEKTKGYVIDNINEKESEFVLDIATGRGALLIEILKNIEVNSKLICTDLSFMVLKYDRIKNKGINKNIQVNYIACDATNMPFKDNAIGTAVSFLGTSNMQNLFPKALKETKRVLDEKGFFIDTYITIDKNSEGYKFLEEYSKKNNVTGSEKGKLNEEMEKAHTEAGFSSTSFTTIGESIGEKCEFDLIPFEGEWFSIVAAKCDK